MKPIHLYEAVAQAASGLAIVLRDMSHDPAVMKGAGIVMLDALKALDAAQDVRVVEVARAIHAARYNPEVYSGEYLPQEWFAEARAAIQALGGKVDDDE